MNQIGKSFTWPGMGVHLEVAVLETSNEESLAPALKAASTLLTTTLHFFVIFPCNTGAFAKGVAPGRLFSSTAELCQQYYLEESRSAWLKSKILRELTPHQNLPGEFVWDNCIINWENRNGTLGEAICLTCGTERDFKQLFSKLLETLR